MPTNPPVARPTAAGAFASTTISVVIAVIAALAFVFSFGNVWALALHLGVPHPIAPLIAPMVDLSVVGLLVALHHLAAQGADPTQLRSPTRLMHLCALLTLALNTAEPLLAGHYGRAALDTVAPALLLGWGAVGPVLLRHLRTRPAVPDASDHHRRPRDVAPPSAAAPRGEGVAAQTAPTPQGAVTSAGARSKDTKVPTSGKRTGRPPAATMERLIAIARPAVAEHGVSGTVVKKALRDANTPISSARFTELMKHLRDEHASAPVAATPESRSAQAHPAQT